MIDRRTCLALRERFAALEKNSKRPQPGDAPSAKTQDENASAEGASREPSKNSGETRFELEGDARVAPAIATAPAQPKPSRKGK